MAATRFRLTIGDQPGSRPVPEPIKHGTLGSFWSPVSLARANGTKGGNCSKRHDEEHDDGNFEENQYSIRDRPQSQTHGI
jgi:hypothetical protein